jgi:NADPH:quinone reductase
MSRLRQLGLAATVGLTWLWAIATARPVPDTMLAAAIDQGGGPEVLTIHRLPLPKAGAGQVLIAMHAAGVAVWEVAERQHPSERAHFPLIIGSEGAGLVAAVGPDVQGFKVGDAVYGVTGASYAQYATARAASIAQVPKGVSLTEAAVLGISGLSAVQGLEDVLAVKPGETLIIHGAAGAVGTFALQMAKRRGVKVLATASDDAGLALASRLGADAVVNGRSGDIVAAAKRLAPQGIDAVLGLAGGDALERCIDALRHDGRGRVAYLYGMEPLPQPRYGIRMTLYSFVADSEQFERLNREVETAHLKVLVAAEYPLAQAAAAHKRLEAGHLLGKIVLRID